MINPEEYVLRVVHRAIPCRTALDTEVEAVR
jgi:hypothetical protein